MATKDYPVIPADRSDDLHHLEIATEADLVVFMAGNQFMAMADLIAAFKQKYSQVEKIFYETLPPGLELKQILAGGAVFKGRLLDVRPDVYTAVNQKAMQRLVDAGRVELDDYQLYLHNRLSLMVTPGNPADIETVEDLSREDVRISQPDPANEDIAFHIMDMYREAGGEELVQRIMEEKRAEGTTVFTIVHHRETPLRIAKKTVDVGPVWATEVIHAAQTGLEFDVVEPGEDLDQRDQIDYYVCKLKNAPHPENAERFLNFLISPEAQAIYEKFGFVPHRQ
jgi:ABC-type molybdate transport system substrate-binding protein